MSGALRPLERADVNRHECVRVYGSFGHLDGVLQELPLLARLRTSPAHWPVLKVVDQPFGGRVTRKIVGVEMRSGRMTQTLEVMPGRRKVRVEVSWDDEVKSETTQLDVGSGRRLRLKAKLGSLGGLRKNLSLDWS